MAFAWSHSALKDFEGCARRYHVVRVAKRYPFVKTEQILYGDKLHKAAEDYANGKPLPNEFAFIQEIIDALLSKTGDKYPEHEMALDAELRPCGWFDKQVWVRGKSDLTIVDSDARIAWVVDYKTGNNKFPDRDQLELMALLTFCHFPEVEQVNSALLYVVKNSMVKHKTLRADADALWWKYRERVAKIEAAHANGVWNPSQSPLCRWCPVKDCEFNPG